MRSPEVSLDIPPGCAELITWCRDATGAWWALIAWEEHIVEGMKGGSGRSIEMSSWVSASHVRKLPGVDYSNVSRQDRRSDPEKWPGLYGRRDYWCHEGWHLRGFLNGEDPLPGHWTRHEAQSYPSP